MSREQSWRGPGPEQAEPREQIEETGQIRAVHEQASPMLATAVPGSRLAVVTVLLLALLVVPACHHAAPGFVEGTTLGVVATSPSQFPVVFLNSHTGVGLEQFPEQTWSTVDVSRTVPLHTKAIFLAGLLIITHGSAAEVCDLTLAYRREGDTAEHGYAAQTVDVTPDGGARTPHSTWVPIHDGKFQVKWTRSTQGSWPEHCAYGINLSVVAYLR